MYMRGVDTQVASDVVSELEGCRVLITGLSVAHGVDVARTFAELKTRLVLQTSDLSPAITELVGLLSQSTSEIKLYTHDISSPASAVRFACAAAQAFGGLEAVINLASISREEMSGVKSDADAERLVTEKIGTLAHLTQVTANRMRLVFSEGLILNVVSMPAPANGREAAIAAYVRATLATMTRSEAVAWADHGIRINAIGPRVAYDGNEPLGAYLTSEPDLAALALELTSRRSRSLSGHVFDAEGAASLHC